MRIVSPPTDDKTIETKLECVTGDEESGTSLYYSDQGCREWLNKGPLLQVCLAY